MIRKPYLWRRNQLKRMTNSYLYFARCKEGAILPTKRKEDSGYDIYSCFEEESLLLNPGDIRLIPTGICSAFSIEFVFFIKERSSTGVAGLSTRAGVIDSGYRGEINIALNNVSNIPILIDKGVSKVVKEAGLLRYPYSKAIAQGVFCLIPTLEAIEITQEELLAISSTRGASFLGASGK
jgi:dUTP pyrophosphatase